MAKTHICVTRRNDVAIVREDNGVINIKYSSGDTMGNIVGNIVFCPFCGVNLKEAKN
jgi:hypothetical protein